MANLLPIISWFWVLQCVLFLTFTFFLNALSAPEADWKLIVVAKGTPEFDEWNDIEDVPDYILSGIREWFRWRSYGEGEDELQYYACDEEYQNKEKVTEVVHETYEYWVKLVEGVYDDEIAMEDPEDQVWYHNPGDINP